MNPSSSTTQQSGEGRGTIDQVRACAGAYAHVPAIALPDVEWPRSPEAAVAGSDGTVVRGRLVTMGVGRARMSGLSAEIDGAPRSIEVRSTPLLLQVEVTEVDGTDATMAVGDVVSVAVPFVSGVVGSGQESDVEAMLADITAACSTGLSVQFYPRSIEGTEVDVDASAFLLVAEDGRFAPLAPAADPPYGVESISEFEAALAAG